MFISSQKLVLQLLSVVDLGAPDCTLNFILGFLVGGTFAAFKGFLSGLELGMETGCEPQLVVPEDLYSARRYTHFFAEVNV